MVMLGGSGFFLKTLFVLYSSFRLQTYFGLAIYLVIALLICAALAAASYLLSLSSAQDSEKKSEYECGFEPFDSATRLPFDVHFYLVGILFLVFDVEIALLFPWVLTLQTCGWFSFYLVFAFIFLLSIGFLYEWKRGALIWPSRQLESVYKPISALLVPALFCQDNRSICELNACATGFGVSWFKLLFWPFIDFSNFNYMTTLFLGWVWSDEKNIIFAFFKFVASTLLPILPELTLMLIILYLIVSVALELGASHSKRLLSLESLNAAQVGIIFVFFLYAFSFWNISTQFLYNGYAVTSIYILVLKMLLLLTVFFILNNSAFYIKNHKKELLEYPLIVMLSLFFMILLISSQHLVSSFLCLVGFSLNVYVLILFDAPESVAREAGIKYYYLSTLSSGLLLYGIFLIFLVLKTGHFCEINQILTVSGFFLNNNLLNSAVLFLLIGIFFKLSAFPGHLWAAEVYEGSPDVITAFFMLPVKVAVLTFLFQLLTVAFEPAKAIWQPLLSFASLSSIFWGSFAAVFEKKTKRFLAYASINQIGFLFIGICCGSLEGYRSTLVYLFIYSVMNISFLTIFLNIKLHTNLSLVYLTDFRGLGKQNWLWGWSLAITMFSMAGIPPLAGFFGKYYLILHAQEQNLYLIVIFALLTSLISAYYYLRIIKIIWFESFTSARSVMCFFEKKHLIWLFLSEAFLFTFFVTARPILQLAEFCVVSTVNHFFL